MYYNLLLWVHLNSGNFSNMNNVATYILYIKSFFHYMIVSLGNMERQTRKHLVKLLKRQINLVVGNEGKLDFHRLSGICTFLELLGIIASYGNHQWINI